MSKIGVGVGDEFPLDDGAAKAADAPRTPEDDRAEFEEWKRRRDAIARNARPGAPSARNGAAAATNGRNSGAPSAANGATNSATAATDIRFFFGYGPWRIVGIAAAIVLIAFALSHIGYIIVGLAAIALLFAAYHHFGHDPLDIGPRDYARPVTTAAAREPGFRREAARSGGEGLEMRHRHGHRFHGAAAEAMRAAADAMDTGERTTTRVQLEMPPQAMERLQRLKEKTEAASYAEVIRNALRLFEALVQEHEAGAEFSLKRANGETVAYKIFV